jgi:hypothetical protein
VNGPIRLSQRHQLFVSFAKFSNFDLCFLENDTVGFHIRRNRTEPLETKGLTGPEAVTNILSQISAGTYNAAHVGTIKTPPAPADPFISLSAAARANPFIYNGFQFSFINTSHPAQAGKQTINAT